MHQVSWCLFVVSFSACSKSQKDARRLSNHKTRNVLQEQQRNLPLPTELHEVSSFLRLGQIGDAGGADWDAPGIHSPNTNRLSGCYRFTKEDTIVGHDSSAGFVKEELFRLSRDLSPSKKRPRSKSQILPD